LDRYTSKAGKAEKSAVTAFKEKMMDWVIAQD
jgi:hypothetical protein